ncbi:MULTISPECIES: carboxylesterase/lipase family protein [Protofrankia]|uniref:Carboxylesterase type B n=1 Tax=Candidatus Protofrankia datiscae TaxID=2716812 RepID=F8B3P9_9ACTN|nr:Carboxylesterase type B [Candidatus Protofrankia datiscae]
MGPVRIRSMTSGVVSLLFVVALCLTVTSCSADSTHDDREQDGGGSTRTSPTVVSVTGGTVRGAHTALGTSFYGIPYAAPPVGDQRWRSPQPVVPWPGIRNATKKAHPCLQGSPDDGGLGEQSDEDCLFVNVHVPATETNGGTDGGPTGSPGPNGDIGGEAGNDRAGDGRLPVMFWIHGGGFVGGSANEYDGSLLAAAGRVIVVSVEYRLGILGYLALPSLNAEGGQSGNSQSENGRPQPGDSGTYAVQDITAALRWVRDNIAAFHGDPGNVTVFGESAGAISTCALLASPPAAGLFHRAIVQSGPCSWPFLAMPDAERTGTDAARRLGCADPARAAACMRALPARDVLAAADQQTDILNPFPWAPVTGGRTLPAPLSTAIATGTFAKVPVIIGTVKDEGRIFTEPWSDRAGRLTDQQVNEILDQHFHDRIGAVLRDYPPGSAPPTERLARVITDALFTCPSVTSASMLTRAGVSVFSYEFDLPGSAPYVPDTLPGASHGWELGYLIPDADRQWPGKAHRELSATMITYWTRFAATGNPNTPPAGAADGRNGVGAAGRTLPTTSPPTWPVRTTEQAQTLTITPGDIHPISTLADDHHCATWQR